MVQQLCFILSLGSRDFKRNLNFDICLNHRKCYPVVPPSDSPKRQVLEQIGNFEQWFIYIGTHTHITIIPTMHTKKCYKDWHVMTWTVQRGTKGGDHMHIIHVFWSLEIVPFLFNLLLSWDGVFLSNAYKDNGRNTVWVVLANDLIMVANLCPKSNTGHIYTC